MTKLEKIIYIFENANIEGLCEPEYNEMMEWLRNLDENRFTNNGAKIFNILNEDTINGAI